MDEELFRDAMFELCDLHTESIALDEYVGFLRDLLDKMKAAGLGTRADAAPSPANLRRFSIEAMSAFFHTWAQGTRDANAAKAAALDQSVSAPPRLRRPVIAEPTPCPEPYAESAPLLRPRPRPNPPFVDTPATLKKLKPLAGVPGTNEMQRLSRELLSREMLSREGLLRQLGHHRLPPPTCSPLRGLPKSRSTGMLSLAPLVDGGRARLIEREDIDPRPLNKAKILVTKSRSRHDCHTGLHESWSDAKREAKRPQMLPVSEGDPRPRTPHTFRGALWNPATNRHQ